MTLSLPLSLSLSLSQDYSIVNQYKVIDIIGQVPTHTPTQIKQLKYLHLYVYNNIPLYVH